MSVKLTNLVWEHIFPSSTHKWVLYAIADNGSDDALSYISNESVATKVQKSRRTTQLIIDDLIHRGYITIARAASARRPPTYRLNLTLLQSTLVSSPHKSRGAETAPLAATEEVRGAGYDPVSDQDLIKFRSETAPLQARQKGDHISPLKGLEGLEEVTGVTNLLTTDSEESSVRRAVATGQPPLKARQEDDDPDGPEPRDNTPGTTAPFTLRLDNVLLRLRAGLNQPAVLAAWYQELFGDVADRSALYGRIGKAAGRVGGYPRLAQLLVQAASHRPVGDVLNYVEAMSRNSGTANQDDEAPPIAPEQRAVQEIPEITAPPGTLWDDVLDRLGDGGITRLNVERAREGIRCLGWSGETLVLAVTDPQVRYLRNYLASAVLQALGTQPEIRYIEQFGKAAGEGPSRAPPVSV